MDTILSAKYSGDVKLDGILSPNDTLARAALTAVKSAGKELPVVTGQDAEVESIKSILAGEQYSSIQKSTTDLVHHVVGMVQEPAGQAPEVRHRVLRQRRQGRSFLPPDSGHHHKDNIKEVLSKDPTSRSTSSDHP